MIWRLGELLAPWLNKSLPDDWAGCAVKSVSIDTRHLQAGAVFIASVNRVGDGRVYIPQAIDKGAVGIVLSAAQNLADKQAYQALLNTYPHIPVIEIPGLDQIAGAVIARFYGDPSAQQTVIAITGTNGKTTCSYWLAQALTWLGKPCGVIGTLGAGADWRSLMPTGHTTPDAVTLQRNLAEWLNQGVAYVALEASSHALDQSRLAGLTIRQAVLTQVTRDHLDYHPSVEAYAEAKQRLFAWPSLMAQILNGDDALGQKIYRHTSISSKAGLKTYMYFADPASFIADAITQLAFTEIVPQAGGYSTQLWVRQDDIVQKFALNLSAAGRYNLSNALAVLAVLLAMETPLDQAIMALQQCQLPPGRMQIVPSLRGLLIYVDFAHTPEALSAALTAGREQLINAKPSNQLWVVFGCGGQRDAGKRPLMGQVAAELADKIMLTSDNPRNEIPEQIIAEIKAGIPMHAMSRVQSCVDRRQAISKVLQEAVAGDVILVAGKGHETTQTIGDQSLPFADVEVIIECLEKLAHQE